MSTPYPQVEVRTYEAKTQAAAAKKLAEDAPAFVARGLYPTTQVWSGPRIWLKIVTPLILLAVGFFLLGGYGLAIAAVISVIYLIAVRPKGSLTVTYIPQVQPAPAYAPTVSFPPAYPGYPPVGDPWGMN